MGNKFYFKGEFKQIGILYLIIMNVIDFTEQTDYEIVFKDRTIR